jgi:uncharacterized protein (TIGR00369 family)/uncharacterized protein (TIGR03067 family)
MERLSALSGVWIAESRRYEGKIEGQAELRGLRLIVSGDRFALSYADGTVELEGTLAVDPAGDRRAVDVRVAGREAAVPAIYELAGETLTTAFPLAGGGRPKDFTAAPGSGVRVTVYRRAGGAEAGAGETAGAARIRLWFEVSPFNRHLGLRLGRLERERAEVVLPFAAALPTLADVVHGGAISALADTAATLVSWAGVDDPGEARGATVTLTVEFLAPARGRDLTATARVLRRGRALCFSEVDITEPDGRLVAKALATYKLG